MRRLLFFAILVYFLILAPSHLISAGAFEYPVAVTGADTEGLPDTKSLTGSYVEFDPSMGGEECYLPGVPQSFVFMAYSYSPDYEYAYGVWLRFPEGWTILSVSSFGESCNNGTWGGFSYVIQDPPNIVQISHARYHGNNGADCTCYYMVNAIPAGPRDANVGWYWWGDGYGSPPYHPCSDDGYTPSGWTACDQQNYPPAVIPACSIEPGVYLFPAEQTKADCPGIPAEFNLDIRNETGAAETFTLSYNVSTGNGTLTGPPSITLDDGEQQSFSVYLTSSAGLLSGELVTATIGASGGGYSDTAIITQIITLGCWVNIATEPNSGRMDNAVVTYNGLVWSLAGYNNIGENSVRYYDPSSDTWTTVPGSAPPFGLNYARSGAAYGNKGYIYGDTLTAGFTGLWSYNMDTNTWANESPSGTAPAQTGIWAPAWAADPSTGLLYITGGATTAGGGNLTTVYVYDPIGNAWLAPLPNFTSPRAFHSAWIFTDPATGHTMLAVGGGVDAASVVLSSTQCYDFVTGAWNAENADIPELSQGWWGMGYATSTVGTDTYLWLLGGSDAAFAILPGTSNYYDVTAGTWNDGGIYHNTHVYRTSAASLNGDVYKIGGSTGGFSPTGLASRFINCTPPPEYTVTLLADPDDIGVILTGAGDYHEGDLVEIEASPETIGGYVFSEWTGDHIGLIADPGLAQNSFIMPGHDVTFTALYVPDSNPGDNCDNPIVVQIPAGLDYADTGQTTCGRGNSYQDGASNYNNGEDIFYRLDVTQDTTVLITMVPYGTWSGLFLYSDCPANLTPGDWIEIRTGSSTDPRLIEIELLASESPYYIMVDTWPAPNCMDFDLYIVALSSPDGPDAAINSWDISFIPALPLPGDTVEITARVHNIGDVAITSGNANFYYSMEPGVDLQLIETSAFSTIEPSQFIDITVNWNTSAEMDPAIYILTVDITDVMPDDINPDNNTAYIDIGLPVELGFFSAQGAGNRVSIKWQTITETDNLGFNLYRVRGSKINQLISYIPVKLNSSIIPGQGTSSSPHTYTYTDQVKNGGNYFYMLECISTSGIVTDVYRTRLQWLF